MKTSLQLRPSPYSALHATFFLACSICMTSVICFTLCLFAIFSQPAFAQNLSTSPAPDSTLSAAQLEQLIKASSTAVVQYEEQRESPWLDVPQRAQGTFSIEGSVLIKTARSPRQEIWRLHKEYMEAIQPLQHPEMTPEQTRKILYRQAPGIGVFANALRAVVMGNLDRLPEHFMLEITGTELGWHLALTPKHSEDQRALSRIEFTGARVGIKTIVVTETQGDKTTTTLLRALP